MQLITLRRHAGVVRRPRERKVLTVSSHFDSENDVISRGRHISWGAQGVPPAPINETGFGRIFQDCELERILKYSVVWGRATVPPIAVIAENSTAQEQQYAGRNADGRQGRRPLHFAGQCICINMPRDSGIWRNLSCLTNRPFLTAVTSRNS